MNRTARRLLVVLAAAAAALLVWALAVPLAGVDLTVPQGDTALTVGPGLVAAAALAAGLAAWGLLAILERATARGRRIWTITAATVLALSLLGPLGAAGTAAVLVLLAMHAVVGGVLIAGLARR
ncbi:hypothetical protein GCM10009853_028020 [Glycomyces scopariae]|uniref:Uncharacterized protein n=1 Tax=Glycomyces sambucus TaxID=380244 RepID=A0A1G9FNT4_9ACTN|nr:DUF6069 family protein [Glycomyces sambucus]SDK89992.1 hypothetical protein SAMN05216298_1926 [Glycomyces sambucus]